MSKRGLIRRISDLGVTAPLRGGAVDLPAPIYSASFDGANEAMQTASAVDLSGTSTSCTAGCWVKWQAAASVNADRIMDAWDTSNARCWLMSCGNSGYYGDFMVTITDDGITTGKQYRAPEADFTTNAWYLVGFTWVGGGAGDGTLKLWVNGSESTETINLSLIHI